MAEDVLRLFMEEGWVWEWYAGHHDTIKAPDGFTMDMGALKSLSVPQAEEVALAHGESAMERGLAGGIMLDSAAAGAFTVGSSQGFGGPPSRRLAEEEALRTSMAMAPDAVTEVAEVAARLRAEAEVEEVLAKLRAEAKAQEELTKPPQTARQWLHEQVEELRVQLPATVRKERVAAEMSVRDRDYRRLRMRALGRA